MSGTRFRFELAWLILKERFADAQALIDAYAAQPLPDYSLSDSETTDLPDWCK